MGENIKTIKVELNEKIRKIGDILWIDLVETFQADGFDMDPLGSDTVKCGMKLIYAAFNDFLMEMATDLLEQTGDSISQGRIQWKKDLLNIYIHLEADVTPCPISRFDAKQLIMRVMDQFGVDYS